LFLTMNLLAGHGVISRWVELPTFPLGTLVIMALVLGIFSSLVFPGLVQSRLWWTLTALLGWTLFCSGIAKQYEEAAYIEFTGNSRDCGNANI
jgi:hypothetical protein